MNFIHKSLDYLSSKKERINNFLPIFLASYLVLLILPYVFGRVDALNTFFSTGWSQNVYRLIVMIYAFIYLALVGLSNEIKIKWCYLIGGGILLLLLLISSIIGPRDIYFPDGTLLITASPWWYVFNFVKFFFAVSLFIFVLSFIPPIMKSLKVMNISLFILIGVCLVGVILTFVFEYQEIKDILLGVSAHKADIHSIFQSKNTYGLFLFLASLASSFLIFTNEDDNRYLLFFIPLVIFTFMAAIVGCRTALIVCLLLIVYLVIRTFLILYKTNRKSFIISTSIIGSLLLLFILYMAIPPFHNGSLSSLYKIVTYTFSSFFSSLEGRGELWKVTGEFMKGHYFWFGANFTNSQYLLGAYNGHFRDFHSGYVKWFASMGVIGSAIYIALFIYIFYLVVKAIKKNPFDGLLVLIYLLCTMIYAVPESYTVFISTSLFTYVTNLLVIVYLHYQLKDNN